LLRYGRNWRKPKIGVFERVNGKYVRSSECLPREAAIREHLNMLADEVHHTGFRES